MRTIIFGSPGAGKGTQAGLLRQEYQLPHLSTGEIFRAAIKNQTTLGKKVTSMLDAGQLVPDDIVVGLVEVELNEPKYENGYILDGFPRTIAQAKAYDNILDKNDKTLDAFLLLKVPEKELISRILSRGEGRSDDTDERIKTRLEIFWSETLPVQKYYQKQGLLKEIDGVGSVKTVFERIKKALPEQEVRSEKQKARSNKGKVKKS